MADRPTFFVDRSLGKAVGKALRDVGAKVELHDDHFKQDADDVDWISRVSILNWVILTKDKYIRRRFEEKKAILQNNAKVFTLTSGNMSGSEMAKLFVGQLTNMESLASTQQAPFIATIGPAGLQIRFPPPDSEEGPGGPGGTKF